MINEKIGNYIPLYTHALNIRTNEIVVPLSVAIIDGTSRFYDLQKDKGHLVCPECRQAHLIHHKVKAEAGGRNEVRNHFARNPKTNHSVDCSIGIRSAQYPHHRTVDNNLAPYFYINTDTPKPDHTYGGRPPRRAWIDRSRLQRLPDWVQKIEYGRDPFLNRREIITPEFVRRPRIDAATDLKSLLRTFAVLNRKPSQLKEAWAIVSGVAIRADHLFLRKGSTSTQHDLSAANTAAMREQNKLAPNFRFPADGAFDKFARQFNEQASGVTHPVLIHFRVESNPRKVKTVDGVRLYFDIGRYQLQRLHPQGIELPTQPVEMSIVLRDPSLFSLIKKGQEFFALAHPYQGDYGKGVKTLTQTFAINRACDVAQTTLDDLRVILENKGRRKQKNKPAPEQMPLVA